MYIDFCNVNSTIFQETVCPFPLLLLTIHFAVQFPPPSFPSYRALLFSLSSFQQVSVPSALILHLPNVCVNSHLNWRFVRLPKSRASQKLDSLTQCKRFKKKKNWTIISLCAPTNQSCISLISRSDVDDGSSCSCCSSFWLPGYVLYVVYT